MFGLRILPHLTSDPTLLPEWIEEFFLASPETAFFITSNADHRQAIRTSCLALTKQAYVQQKSEALEALHESLNHIYSNEFKVTPLGCIAADTQPVCADIIGILAQAMLNNEYAFISSDQISDYPHSGQDYVQWLKNLIASHPANPHPFYCEFLRDQATSEDIRFFLAQETNLDPRFDDILALLQIGTRGQDKMDIANNYWDEMGNGNLDDVHTVLFNKTLKTLDVSPAYIAENMLTEARMSGNLSSALALSRRHHHKAIGYFGVTEYIAPSRFKNVVKAWRRNGLPEEGIAYHDLHIKIDTLHGNSWFKNVIAPTVERQPETGKEIALGVLIRLNSSEKYLTALSNKLQNRAVEESILFRRA